MITKLLTGNLLASTWRTTRWLAGTKEFFSARIPSNGLPEISMTADGRTRAVVTRVAQAQKTMKGASE
jgi:hypothetical protein